MEFVNYGSWVLWVVGFGGSCNGGFWSMVWWIVAVSWFGVVESCSCGITKDFIFFGYGHYVMMVATPSCGCGGGD